MHTVCLFLSLLNYLHVCVHVGIRLMFVPTLVNTCMPFNMAHEPLVPTFEKVGEEGESNVCSLDQCSRPIETVFVT